LYHTDYLCLEYFAVVALSLCFRGQSIVLNGSDYRGFRETVKNKV